MRVKCEWLATLHQMCPRRPPCGSPRSGVVLARGQRLEELAGGWERAELERRGQRKPAHLDDLLVVRLDLVGIVELCAEEVHPTWPQVVRGDELRPEGLSVHLELELLAQLTGQGIERRRVLGLNAPASWLPEAWQPPRADQEHSVGVVEQAGHGDLVMGCPVRLAQHQPHSQRDLRGLPAPAAREPHSVRKEHKDREVYIVKSTANAFSKRLRDLGRYLQAAWKPQGELGGVSREPDSAWLAPAAQPLEDRLEVGGER